MANDTPSSETSDEHLLRCVHPPSAIAAATRQSCGALTVTGMRQLVLSAPNRLCGVERKRRLEDEIACDLAGGTSRYPLECPLQRGRGDQPARPDQGNFGV